MTTGVPRSLLPPLGFTRARIFSGASSSTQRPRVAPTAASVATAAYVHLCSYLIKSLFQVSMASRFVECDMMQVSKCLVFTTTTNNNNLRVSNIRVSNRTLIYNVCPKSALTWPSRHSRHRHLCRFYRSRINPSSRTGACLSYRQWGVNN